MCTYVSHVWFRGKRLMFPGNVDNTIEQHEFARMTTTIQRRRICNWIFVITYCWSFVSEFVKTDTTRNYCGVSDVVVGENAHSQMYDNTGFRLVVKERRIKTQINIEHFENQRRCGCDSRRYNDFGISKVSIRGCSWIVVQPARL